MQPAESQAYELLHEGALALSEIESHGMRIDVPYLHAAMDRIDHKIKGLTSKLKKSRFFSLWRRKFGEKCNLHSNLQLSTMLFDEMQIPYTETTATGRPKTDEATLEKIDQPFVTEYMRLKKLEKLKSTYLQGILRESLDGHLHCNFGLNKVRSYRGSCDQPNLQNIPIRNPEIAKWVRRAFVPRPGHVLVEIDYVAAEVRMAACYHKDPTMLRHIENHYDMHHEMAQRCYLLEKDQVTKDVRKTAKNSFTFPAFYGSYYIDIAKALWSAIERFDLKDADGCNLEDHLCNAHGICDLGDCDTKKTPRKGTFEYHINEVEHYFWHELYPVYQAWRDDWYTGYKQKGYFHTKTGFLCQGVYRRNEVINYPIQGSSFHMLLWSLIQLHKKLRTMKSMIVCQIHDSLIFDVHESEIDDVIALAQQVMTVDLRKHWPWIITPLEIEVEVAQTNWFDKREMEVAT